ncbi:hypothetical protein FEM21_02150 [Flavobacterium seoulense]|uniref:Uncharacterized protein n=1 Tax=Flavobacterium seoulense TaxID=1492738 RepID=A0A066WRL8_9FLAO|nr:hypothetical protein FEM21_02150 [Flavobacterium seoulense]
MEAKNRTYFINRKPLLHIDYKRISFLPYNTRMPKIDFLFEWKGDKTQILGGHITRNPLFSTKKG